MVIDELASIPIYFVRPLGIEIRIVDVRFLMWFYSLGEAAYQYRRNGTIKSARRKYSGAVASSIQVLSDRASKSKEQRFDVHLATNISPLPPPHHTQHHNLLRIPQIPP